MNPTSQGQKRKASEVDNSVESETFEDPQTPNQQELIKPPISPLLTSLLKSPSSAQNVTTSSILHSAITNQRFTNSINNPTIASLLNSTTNVTVSPGLQQLVSTAIGQEPTDTSMLENASTILDDATDTLPNLKVEDIESTILSSEDPLPEIKNEEVEVIISDLIENADIVTDPEQHLQLDENDDIISNLENELDELVNEEENAARERARVEKERLNALARQNTEKINSDIAKANVPTNQIEIKQENLNFDELSLKNESMSEDLKKDFEKSSEKSDPFEFEEDPIFQPKPSTSLIKSQETLKVQIIAQEALKENKGTDVSSKEIEDSPKELEVFTEKDNLKKDDEVINQDKNFSIKRKNSETSEPGKENDNFTKEKEPSDKELKHISRISTSSESSDSKIDHIKKDSQVTPGSVEIVEVVMEEDDVNKDLNNTQIQDIVYSNIPNNPKKNEADTDKEGKHVKNEDNKNIPTIKVDPDIDEQTDSIEFEIKLQDEKKMSDGETSERVIFTPDYTDDIFDDLNIEVKKIEKTGKAKRDYSRTKKKEDKEFDLLMTDIKEENEEETSSERDFQEEKKTELKPKLKIENDRSNSPWTEEEDQGSTRNTRRYSTPATPIDSIPNSPASGAAFEDDREYKIWKKSVMLVYSRLATHKYASLFLKPITNDQAPGYHSIVYRPMDLQTIRKNVESGVIRTTAEFQRDVLLMFNNAIMYNKTNDHIYNMAKQMQQECLQQIQILLQAQGDLPARRETRTSEPGSKRKRISEESTRGKKRKED